MDQGGPEPSIFRLRVLLGVPVNAHQNLEANRYIQTGSATQKATVSRKPGAERADTGTASVSSEAWLRCPFERIQTAHGTKRGPNSTKKVQI